MFRLKICGVTHIADALAVKTSGADAIGMIFCPSPRRIDADAAREIHRALGPGILRVGVFRDQTADEICITAQSCGLDLIQLHGREEPDWADGLGLPYIKSLDVGEEDLGEKDLAWRNSRAAAVILDTPGGGSGKTFDWRLFTRYRMLEKPMILAGGLNSENVAEAISALHPDGVDVGSGVEAFPGRKDWNKIREFTTAALEAFRRLQEGL